MQCEVCHSRMAEMVLQKQILGRTAYLQVCAECASGLDDSEKNWGMVTLIVLLDEGLKSPDPEMRAMAAMNLGFLGPQAKSVLSALKERLTDENPDVRREVAEALRRIDAA